VKFFRKRQHTKSPISPDHKYQFLIETATDAIYLIDGSGRIVDTNHAAEQMLDYSKSTLLSFSVADVDPNFTKSEFLAFWQTVPLNEQKVFNSTHRKKDGTLIPVELSGKKFTYQGETFFYGIARDISERVLASKQLDKQTKKFELLSQSATEMLELPDLKAIYQYICHTIHQRYPKTIVLVISVDEKSMDSKFVSASGVDETLLKKLMDVVGFDPFQKSYRIVPGHHAIWKQGRSHEFAGGLTEFSAGEFPAIGTRIAQQLFSIHRIYTIGINKGENLLSAVHVLTRDKHLIVEHDFVESFVKQAGIIIQKKILEEELVFQSMILDQIQDAVTVTDLQGTITYVNKAEEELSKRSAPELIGQKTTIYGENPDKASSQQEIIDKTLELGSWRGEMVNYTPDGQEIILDVRTQSVAGTDGIPIALVGVSTDITKRKAIENELIKAKEMAEESDRLKTAFLANISHEVRTPMNGILGFVDLMSESMVSETKRKDYLRIIHESGRRLLDTIDDILAASRIETGAIDLHLESTDLRDLLRYHFEFFNVQAKAKGLMLILEPDCYENSMIVKTDVPKLNSVMINLLKNSVKFTEQGHIRFGYLKEERQLRFFVEDTGIGIPADQQEVVFQRFIQSDLRINRMYEGSGLGLSIAKAYVELMGGNLWMTSEVGKGTTFYFTLLL